MTNKEYEKIQKQAFELLKNGKPAEARPLLEKLRQMNPDNINAWELYDWYLSQSHNDYGDEKDNLIDKAALITEKLKVFQNLTRLNPENRHDVYLEAEYGYGIWRNLALAYADYCSYISHDPKDMRAAIDALDRAIETDKSKGISIACHLEDKIYLVQECLIYLSRHYFDEDDIQYYEKVAPGSIDILINCIDDYLNSDDKEIESHTVKDLIKDKKRFIKYK